MSAICAAWTDTPFEWGRADCIHFCMACEKAIFGSSVFDDFPDYKTEAGGFRHMRKLGHKTIPDLLDAHFDRVPVLAARRGDWAVLEHGSEMSFGVVTGGHVRVMSETGLASYPVVLASAAWRVDR